MQTLAPSEISPPPSGTKSVQTRFFNKCVIPRRRIQLPPNAAARTWETLQAGQIFEGPHLPAFEQAFASAAGTQWAIGVASARVGLYLTIQALGFRPGDEIICPAYTFHVMPAVLRALGLIPVFVEADPTTYNMDPSLIENSITPKTKAILMTHLFGQPCEIENIFLIARRKGLRVIEDCAHACGAEYRNKRVGSFGDVGLFSFGPGKNLPCFGGGMVTTNDDEIARRLRKLVECGTYPSFPRLMREVVKTFGLAWGTGPFGFRLAGYPILRLSDALLPGMGDRLMEESHRPQNSSSPKVTRLANLQAVMGLAQLVSLDERNRRRRENADALNEALAHFPQLQLPKAPAHTNPIYLYYRLLVHDRERFRRKLLRLGIDTKRDDMTNCGGAATPVAASLVKTSVEIPNDPSLSKKEIQTIVAGIRRVLNVIV